MSRKSSRAKAAVVQIHEAFRVLPQAYYRSKNRPAGAQGGGQRRGRQGPWASTCLRREGLVASRRRVWATMRAKGLVLAPIRERQETPQRGQVVVADSNPPGRIRQRI